VPAVSQGLAIALSCFGHQGIRGDGLHVHCVSVGMAFGPVVVSCASFLKEENPLSDYKQFADFMASRFTMPSLRHCASFRG
jgi:hypothetical protein